MRQESDPAMILVGFTIPSTENDNLLRLLFVPTQGASIVHRAVELAEDSDPPRFVPWS